MLAVNLLDIFNAFGDKRNRNDFDSVFGLVATIGCAFVSDDILCMTRTPRRTSERRLKRSSTWSADCKREKGGNVYISDVQSVTEIVFPNKQAHTDANIAYMLV